MQLNNLCIRSRFYKKVINLNKLSEFILNIKELQHSLEGSGFRGTQSLLLGNLSF